jgi:hypothetical protein
MGDRDGKSPWGVFVLVAVVHLTLWAALGATPLFLVPRLQRLFADFGMR